MEWIGRYWVEVGFGAILAALGACYRYLAKKVRGQIKEQNALRDGMQALLRDRIIETYNRRIDRGYCPIYELENIHALYKSYAALGGNGAVKDLIEKIEHLPTVKPDAEK